MGKIIPMRHPEARDGEVFIGNADAHSFPKIIYINKRRGDCVLPCDNCGRCIDQSRVKSEYQLFPVFAPIHEVEAVRRALYGIDTEVIRI